MDHYLDALSLWLLSWTTILLCCKNINDKSKPQAHEISLSVCWDFVVSMIFTWYGAKNTERMVLRKLGASFHPRLRFTLHPDRPLVGKLSYFYLFSLVPPSNQPSGIVCVSVCACVQGLWMKSSAKRSDDPQSSALASTSTAAVPCGFPSLHAHTSAAARLNIHSPPPPLPSLHHPHALFTGRAT